VLPWASKADRMIDAGTSVSGCGRGLLGYLCESEVARLVRLGSLRACCLA
jgi:hypothetical protein